MADRVAKVAFVASATFLLALIVFAYGLAVGRYRIWPFDHLQAAQDVVHAYLTTGHALPENRRVSAPPDAPRERFVVHAPALRASGGYAFLGWDGALEGYAAWLYDADGHLRHRWPIDYARLDPDGPSNGVDAPHAFHVTADGSILVGYNRGDVMARLDACGDPVWIRPGIFHHAMTPAQDGSIWTWHAEGTAFGHYHYLEKFDPKTGANIEEIGLVEDIIANADPTSNIFGVRPDHPFQRFERDPSHSEDYFHPNDVEALSSELAPRFPMFAAGDLLLSLRNLDLVLVIDPDDYRIKWRHRGPWIAQHDPDFTADGRISVYSNNAEHGRSEIIKIDPATDRIGNDLYDADFSFYSETQGTHEYLPNGNLLIAIPGEGRVVELAGDGRKVLEFNNVSRDGPRYNDAVVNVEWLEPGYLEVEPACAPVAAE